MPACYIGLGSNLDKPIDQLQNALATLAKHPSITLITTSPFYASAPVGPSDQPDFINAVAKIDTTLTPLELLDELQAIETAHLRKRLRHWGPRTLDLDILLYGNETIQSARLTVPHLQMHLRNFVLAPLLAIEPQLSLPNGDKISELLKTCAANALQEINTNSPH